MSEIYRKTVHGTQKAREMRLFLLCVKKQSTRLRSIETPHRAKDIPDETLSLGTHPKKTTTTTTDHVGPQEKA
jgi:hypothetical protein